ncbi:MAG: iron-sulfur cluster assembly scaffold protein [Spirochaetaceae bacterium]|nr:MAG: iron-sulfur cluster assembly scaffold protein [Spirochaetaceae bacterium]
MTTLYEKYSQNPVNVGRMNDPMAAAWNKGPCGDTMEMFLAIRDKTIIEACFFTDGCGATYACGSLATLLVKNRSINDALGISPKEIIDKLENLPADHHHCAILAASTLYKAIADYMLQY